MSAWFQRMRLMYSRVLRTRSASGEPESEPSRQEFGARAVQQASPLGGARETSTAERTGHALPQYADRNSSSAL